jgi:phosphatidylinositol-3-phosphatase
MTAPLKRLMALCAAALALTTAIAAASSTAEATGRSTSSSPPVVLILLENHSYGEIVGAHAARYINKTFLPSGTLFTRYFAVSHPSLPNYLALTSGSRDGCHSDLCRTDIKAMNIFAQLRAHGLPWAGWDASMPRNCYRSDTSIYAHRHNPAAYYSDIYPKPCRSRDVRYPSTLPLTLPAFTFVTPNICQDMHSCSVATGDKWLSGHVPHLLGKGAIVILVFDEGTTDAGGGGHVMCAEAGPGIAAGRRVGTKLNHYGLLAGLENYFGLRLLAGAKTNKAVPV